ncbi:hypothetical protein M747DRAFT_282427 [Aspergillus niger ATCC 13496]|uniref:Contig An09c0090, genomic contig n=3 Tax=Aspergillus niger TaxID=5061 RepID=A2QTV8_ASPNC|nr:uncharacterized protein An09g03430 [Aspergillus niger]RDH18816.1 hypothetical protein M747DRAFT_282427 [Aspergillus niger ATCC 13496]CAK40283.1 unnamed protein product [Aspergillus niger]
MAAEHYTTGIGATLYKVHVEGGEVGLVGRQIATKPLIRFGQIVSFIITYSRCLSPDLPRHQLSDEPSRHPPFTSSTAPVVVQRAASCTVKCFVSPSGNGQRPDIMYISGRRNGDKNGPQINRDVPATNYLCNKGDHKYKADYRFHELRCHGFGIEGEELSVMKELSICPFEKLGKVLSKCKRLMNPCNSNSQLFKMLSLRTRQSCLTERPGDDYSDGPIRRTCQLFTLSPQSGKTTLYAVTTPSSVVTALRMRSLVTKHNTAIVYLCLPKRPWQFGSILAWMRCKDNVAQEMARSARWQECSIKTAFPYVVETYSATYLTTSADKSSLEMRHLALERCIATATWTKQGTAVNPSDNARLSNEAAKQRLRKSGYPQIFDFTHSHKDNELKLGPAEVLFNCQYMDESAQARISGVRISMDQPARSMVNIQGVQMPWLTESTQSQPVGGLHEISHTEGRSRLFCPVFQAIIVARISSPSP